MMRHPHYYILNDKREPVPVADVVAFGKWFETANRQVADSQIGSRRVSTIFLGIDHNFSSVGDPIIWETMSFPDEQQWRCSGTWEDAEAMHRRAVAEITASEGWMARLSAWFFALMRGKP